MFRYLLSCFFNYYLDKFFLNPKSVKKLSLILFYFILVLTFLLAGCSNKNEEYLRIENKKLQDKNDSLENTNKFLVEEIRKLKETDQFYYQSAVAAFENKEYEKAIEQANKIQKMFPNSSLIEASDKLIKGSQKELAAIYQKEKDILNKLLCEIEKNNFEEAIIKLKEYISETHPIDLVNKAETALIKYEKKSELIREEQEIERITKVKLISVVSKWDYQGTSGNRLLVPQLQLKFKNISSEAIEHLEVKASFINVEKKEIFGEAYSFLIGYSDSPLQPGYSKTAYLYCDTGYEEDSAKSFIWEGKSFPNLYADVYINDKLYRKVNISNIYGVYK